MAKKEYATVHEQRKGALERLRGVGVTNREYYSGYRYFNIRYPRLITLGISRFDQARVTFDFYNAPIVCLLSILDPRLIPTPLHACSSILGPSQWVVKKKLI